MLDFFSILLSNKETKELLLVRLQIIQVFYFRWTKHNSGEGKRYFKMAPIHHHFEKKGWAESTVVIRFWIIAIILALVGLATLKLR